MSNVILKLKDVRQSKNQSIWEFINYLNELKEDISEMLYKESRAWLLLNDLQRELCSKILWEECII